MTSTMLKYGLFLLLISSISCISNTTIESLKQGILPFNEAGNNFFNLIRGDVDPSVIKVEEFQNLSFSLVSLKKITSGYLTHTILIATGITFAILFPLFGFFFCLCRCCGRCGGKVKPMDPRNVKCKKIFYGFLLTIFSIGMMFSLVITLFNNQIVHELIVNPDPSVNIFLSARSQLDSIKTSLEIMKSEVDKSQVIDITNQQMQYVIKSLDGSIGTFFESFTNKPEVRDLVQQSKAIKQVNDQRSKGIYQNELENVNRLLRKFNSNLTTIKENIKQKLSSCSSASCAEIKKQTDLLAISTIEKKNIDKMTDLLNNLDKTEFVERFDKMINVRPNGFEDVKLILDREITNIKNKINEKSIPESVKTKLSRILQRQIEIRNAMVDNIPMPMKNETKQYEYFQAAKNMELYRYYIYIGLCLGVALIIIFYFLGLLYGNCGERPEEDAGCFNRGVGANFLMISIGLSFLFSPFIMVVVLSNISTTSVVQTDFCRYSLAPLKDNYDPKATRLMDKYLQLSLKLFSSKENAPDGTMEALLHNCEKQNFYLAFRKIIEKYLLQNMTSSFNDMDEKIVNNLASQLNLSRYMNFNPFNNISSADFDNIINSLSLSRNSFSLENYLKDLSSLPVNTKEEIASLNSLIAEVDKTRLSLQTIFQHLLNIQNQYTRWKRFAEIFNENRIAIIRSLTPDLLMNIQTNLLPVLNMYYGDIFKNVSCSQLRSSLMELLKVTCGDLINPINGCWYGLGFVLLLVIPALIFASFLVSLYRRIQKYYPDKDEPDYENYLGFYARVDGEAMKNNANAPQSKAPHRGYKPIPLQ